STIPGSGLRESPLIQTPARLAPRSFGSGGCGVLREPRSFADHARSLHSGRAANSRGPACEPGPGKHSVLVALGSPRGAPSGAASVRITPKRTPPPPKPSCDYPMDHLLLGATITGGPNLPGPASRPSPRSPRTV